MRIIGGILKGRKIFQPNDKETRPLRDLVRESIFNLIAHSNKFNCRVENSNILDLFCGVGSFGIECVSRNAKKVTFIENYKNTLQVLKRNILSLKIKDKIKLNEKNCFEFLSSKSLIKEKFDIIFLDPPYSEEKINLLLDKNKQKKILNENGILIIHRHKKDRIKITNKIKILEERNYGISKIIIGN